MTDLQVIQFGGSTEKTFWQLCQLVELETPGEMREQTEVGGCASHNYVHTHQLQSLSEVHQNHSINHRNHTAVCAALRDIVNTTR